MIEAFAVNVHAIGRAFVLNKNRILVFDETCVVKRNLQAIKTNIVFLSTTYRNVWLVAESQLKQRLHVTRIKDGLRLRTWTSVGRSNHCVWEARKVPGQFEYRKRNAFWS